MGKWDGDKQGTDQNGEGSGKARPKLPKGGKIALGTILSLAATTLAIVHRASFLEAQVLLDVTHALFLMLAIGWLMRSAIHGFVGYFRKTEVEGVRPYTLLGISCFNALFSIAWLVVAIFLLLSNSGFALTAAAVILACVLSFLLSLSTHWAAEKAKRPRASEWVRARFRDPLEPGGSTPVGWFLIKLIDWRSAPRYLSTFVAGTLGTLLVILLLTASAAVSERADDEGGHHDTPGAVAQSQRPSGVHPPSGAEQSGIAAPLPPSRLGLPARNLHKTARLLCFIVPPTNSNQGPSELFLCIIMSGRRTTNRALVLTPSRSP